MLETVNGRTLWNQYILMRELDPRPWILVEGDDDCHVIDPNLNRDEFKSVPAHSRHNVLEAMEIFIENGEDSVLFVVDSDFKGAPELLPRHFSISAAYDLEAEILIYQPEILRSMAIAYSRTPAASPISDVEALEMFETALSLASFVGAVRYLSSTSNSGLTTARLPFKHILDSFRRGNAIGSTRRLIKKKSGHGSIVPTVAEIRQIVLDKPRAVHCGHDILSAMCELIAEKRGKTIKSDDFRSSFHAMIDCLTLSRTSIYEPGLRWGLSTRGISPWRPHTAGDRRPGIISGG